MQLSCDPPYIYDFLSDTKPWTVIPFETFLFYFFYFLNFIYLIIFFKTKTAKMEKLPYTTYKQFWDPSFENYKKGKQEKKTTTEQHKI